MSLDTYWGEFLTSPAPMELSLNYCSHGCEYCFANINTPDRKADIKAILRLLRDYPERAPVVASLLRSGYPVVVSNRVDPFANSNYKVAVPIMRVMSEQDIPITLQTKGGRGVDEALEFLKPSVWYISISFTDDALRKRIEPGAPPLEERYALIERLIALGHTVVIGLNPLVEEWLPDPAPVLERLKGLGVHGVWSEMLHFSRPQRRTISARALEAMTPELVDRATGSKWNWDAALFLWDTLAMARELGLETFTIGNEHRSEFFTPWRTLYGGHVFPVMQEFVNWCHDTLPEGGFVTLDDWLGFFAPQLPAGEFNRLRSYVTVGASKLTKTKVIPNRMTYAQLLTLIWHEPRMRANPIFNRAFAAVSVNGQALLDDRGAPVVLFVPGGTLEWRIDFEIEPDAEAAVDAVAEVSDGG